MPALTPKTRTKLQSLSRLSLSAAAVSLLLSGGALAQTAGSGAQSANVQAAYGEWRRLSQNEVNCVDQALKGQRTTLWALIQRGVHPSDAAVAKLRAGCRAQTKAPARDALATTQGITPAAAPATAQASVQGQAKVTVSPIESFPPKPAANKAVSDQALADRAAALAQAAEERAMANKAAADQAAAEKAAADKAAAEKAAADRAAAVKAAADKPATQKVAAAQPAIETARAEAERAKAEAPKAVTAVAKADRLRNDADNTVSEATLAYVASEARKSFFYGLLSSPVCFGLAGIVFLLVQRGRRTAKAIAARRVRGIDETVLH